MKDDFDTYSLFGGDAAGGATPREPAKRSSLRAARPASTRSRYRSDVLSGDAYGFRAPEPVRETRCRGDFRVRYLPRHSEFAQGSLSSRLG